MLEASDAQTFDTTLDTPPAADAVQALRELIERMQADLKFEKTRNEALNFEIARLKRWRFGSSNESLRIPANVTADSGHRDRWWCCAA